MKNKKKKLKGYLFLVPTYVILILLIILPLFYSFIYSKMIDNGIFESITLMLTVLLFIFIVFGIFETFFCMYNLYKNKKINHNTKMFLYILLFFLNIIMVPYYYHNYMDSKKTKKEKKDYFFIYIVLVIVLLTFSIITLTYSIKISNNYKIEEERKEKIKQEVRTVISSKDNTFDMTFRLGFKRSNVSEYELYASDKERNLMTGAFLYETSNYEQKDANAILDKQIEYITQNRKNIKIYKEKNTRQVENKSIITIELKGNLDDSADTIYRLTTLTFNNDNSKVLYVIQTVLFDDYDQYINELDEIIDTINLK